MKQRELGEKIPFSIPTARIFEETLNENLKEKPDALFINVRTLFRNFWTSWKEEERPHFREIYKDFIDEMQQITALLSSMNLAYYLYWPEYRDIDRKLPGALIKTKQPIRQIDLEVAETSIFAVLKRQSLINVIDTLIPAFDGNVWLISHYPIDLLSKYQFKSLKLLQSHTGILVMPGNWNKTIFSNDRYEKLPFNHFTLSIFGDKSKMLKGHPLKFRNMLLKLADKYRWTPVTTVDRIRDGIKTIEDVEMQKAMKLALTSYLR